MRSAEERTGGHELDALERALRKDTGAVLSGGAVRNHLTLNITDNLAGTRSTPDTEVLDAVHEASLAQGVLAEGGAEITYQ